MKRLLTLLLAAFLTTVSVFPQEKAANSIKKDISSEEMKFLSSDALEGRNTGSKGNDTAAEYISRAALNAGLKPLPGRQDLFQTLEYLKVSILPDSSVISVTDTTGRILFTDKIIPMMSPKSRVDLSGEIVFAGYGFSSSVEKYNDFEGLSLKDKIVIIMTRTPDLSGSGLPSGTSEVDENTEVRKLAMLIFSQPKAILYVTDPSLETENGLNDLRATGDYQLVPLFKTEMFDFSLNVYMISRETANALLLKSGQTLNSLQGKIAESKKPSSFTVPDTRASVKISVSYDTVTSSNVVGYLEGSDPVLKNECVIYTAHYDHVGIDSEGDIRNGANDNASGTIGLLNVARAFSGLERKPLRSIVFLWTTGEEVGLHGSSYYVNNPLFPLENTVADINFDMIGRSVRDTDTGRSPTGEIDITGKDTIKVISGGNSKGLVDIAKEACSAVDLYGIDEGKGTHFSGSDHFPFYRKGIPVLFFFSGLHKDYHQPTDDFEFIDFDKLVKVSKAGFLTGYKIANTRERPVAEKKQ